jgi:hypothetical protein
MTKTIVRVTVLVILLVITGGLLVMTAVAAVSSSSGTSNTLAGAVAAAQNSLGADQVTSVKQTGATLQLTIASEDSFSSAVARWYGKILGRQVVSQIAPADGALPISQIDEVDASGADINGGPESVTSLVRTDPLPSGECEGVASSNAADAQVLVKTVKQIEVLGGGCIFVVTPEIDPSSFVSNAGSYLGALIRSIPDRRSHPSLIEVVGADNTPLLLLGWIPGVGGAFGQGVAWIGAGSQSSAVLGTTPSHRIGN